MAQGLGLRPHFHGATHESPLEKKILEKKQWDLREAALAAAILASGVWMIIAGLTKLWDEYKSRATNSATVFLYALCFFANKMSTLRMFPHLVNPFTSVFFMRRLKILLAGDDGDLRALYGYMLTAAGYTVDVVRNGLEAFAEMQVNRPDVVVIDIAMPALNGLDLIVAVRSNDEFATLPVVAITYFGEDICELARAVGATDAIDKPTDVTRMREVIDAAFSRSSSARLRSKGGPPSELSDKNYMTGATSGPATIPPLAHSR